MVATLKSTDPERDRCPRCGERLSELPTNLVKIAQRDAEIERLRAEVESKSEQIGKLYKVCNERDVLLGTLKGIAEYCSTDQTTLGAIERLAAIRNTADRCIAAHQQQPAPLEIGDILHASTCACFHTPSLRTIRSACSCGALARQQQTQADKA